MRTDESQRVFKWKRCFTACFRQKGALGEGCLKSEKQEIRDSVNKKEGYNTSKCQCMFGHCSLRFYRHPL